MRSTLSKSAFSAKGKKSQSFGLSLMALAISLSAVSFAGTPGTPMKQIPGEILPVLAQSTRTTDASPSEIVHANFALKVPNPIALKNFVDSVSNPTSPNYRHFITPEQAGSMFGQPTAVVNQVVAYLQSQGLTVKLVAKSHLNIEVDGTVSQFSKALQTSFGEYESQNPKETENKTFYALDKAPSMPSSIAPSILDIGGLQSYTKAHPMSLNVVQTKGIYGLAPLVSSGFHGENRTIAISNYDGYRLSNVPLYYTANSLPTPTGGVGNNITVITVDGGAGAGTPAGEGDLDIQMILGMAPLCNFRIYDSGGFLLNNLTTEQNDNAADVISESYGWNLGSSDADAAHNIHMLMSVQGITYLAASGDSGTSSFSFGYPAADPDVLMVGGTVASADSVGNRISEDGWSGSGGGWNTAAYSFNIRPNYQKGNGVPTSPNFRLVPDVALNAAAADGAYPFFLNGSLTFGFDGTSFASPVFAGSLGVAEQALIAKGALPKGTLGTRRLGRINDYIYGQNGDPVIWHDITSGTNGNLPSGGTSSAGVGWDTVTGWGAINFNGFVNSFKSIVTTLIAPSSVGIFSGNGANAVGDATSLASIDQVYYMQNSVKRAPGSLADTIITFNLGTNAATAASLTVNLVANSPSRTTDFVFLYNNITHQYDLVGTAAMRGADTTLTFNVGNASNYINASGNVLVVNRAEAPTRFGSFPFREKLDYAAIGVISK